MAFNFPASWDLNPAVTTKLQEIYGTPDGAPPAPAEAPAPGQFAGSSAAGDVPLYRTVPSGPGMLPMRGGESSSVGDRPKTPEDIRKAAASWGGEDAVPAAPDASPAQPSQEEVIRPATPSPGRFVGAHWQDGSRSTTSVSGIDPESLKTGEYHRDVAAGQRLLEGDKRLEAAQQQGVADAVYTAANAAASQQAAAQAQRIETERQAYVMREREKLERMSQAAQQQVDPEAAKGSSGAQLMAAIGIAMGQFGASLNGGPNAALQIVNANIDRNIAAQQANIANAGKAHDREVGLYKDNLAEFGDKQRAALATKVAYLDQVKAMADMQYAKAKNTSNEAQYHGFVAAVNDERAKAADEVAKLTTVQVTTSGNQHFVPGQMVGGGGPTKNIDNLVTLPNGSTVQAANEKQANEIIAHARVINNLQTMNNRALKLRKELFGLHPLSLSPETQERINAIQKELEDMEIEKTSLLSSKEGEGVQRDSEFARNVAKRGFYTEGTSRPSGALPFSSANRRATDANIRAQNERAENEMEGFATAGGAHVVKRGRGTDANGNIVPAARYTGQTASNAEQLAPNGATSKDPAVKVPTADKPLAERTDLDPDLGNADGGGKAPVAKKRK